MRDTMRDLLSKLDNILTESALNPKNPQEDYQAKKQALADLEADPVASGDEEISAAINQRKADLEKEAKSLGVKDYTKDLSDDIQLDGFQIGDDFGISFSEDFEVGSEIVDMLEDGIVISLDETAMAFLEQNGFTFEDGELEEGKIKGADGKACWKGYRYAGTEKGKDKCVPVKEAKSYGMLSPEVVRELYGVYQDVSQGVELHHDAEGADRIYKALKDVAQSHGVTSELTGLMRSAQHSAHMDYDTNPGDFKNWFTYVGDHLEGLKKIHDDREKEPDTELDDSIEMEAKYQGREVPLGKPMAGDVKKSKVYVKNPQGNVVKVNFGDKKMRIKKSNPNRRKSFRARHNCANPGPRHKARYWSCRAW